MNIKVPGKKISPFISVAVAIGLLGFVSASWAQRSPLVKLVMRFGEERVLEDGTRVGITKGEGDLIVVTLSRATSSSSSVSRAASRQLQIGIYKGAATTNSTTGAIRITIKSIDDKGIVKADFRASNGLYGEGSLSGAVNAQGELRLQGEIVTTYGVVTRWKFRLTALVEDDALVNGKYSFTAVSSDIGGEGEFYRAQLEKDF